MQTHYPKPRFPSHATPHTASRSPPPSPPPVAECACGWFNAGSSSLNPPPPPPPLNATVKCSTTTRACIGASHGPSEHPTTSTQRQSDGVDAGMPTTRNGTTMSTDTHTPRCGAPATATTTATTTTTEREYSLQNARTHARNADLLAWFSIT